MHSQSSVFAAVVHSLFSNCSGPLCMLVVFSNHVRTFYCRSTSRVVVTTNAFWANTSVARWLHGYPSYFLPHVFIDNNIFSLVFLLADECRWTQRWPRGVSLIEMRIGEVGDNRTWILDNVIVSQDPEYLYNHVNVEFCCRFWLYTRPDRVVEDANDNCDSLGKYTVSNASMTDQCGNSYLKRRWVCSLLRTSPNFLSFRTSRTHIWRLSLFRSQNS